jgi:TonB family protein
VPPTPGQHATASLLATAIILALHSPAALAQATPPAAQQPDFSAIPKAPKALTMVSPAFPAAAEQARKDGLATMIFDITPAGAVTNIRVGAETPPGLGFGAAAAESLTQWTYPPGQPGTYRVRLKFVLPDAQPAAQINLGDLRVAPDPVTRVAPVYPARELGQGKAGVVRLAFSVDAQGLVADIGVMEDGTSDMAFAQAAQAALAQWIFAPAYGAKSYFIDLTFDRDAIDKGLVKRPD